MEEAFMRDVPQRQRRLFLATLFFAWLIFMAAWLVSCFGNMSVVKWATVTLLLIVFPWNVFGLLNSLIGIVSNRNSVAIALPVFADKVVPSGQPSTAQSSCFAETAPRLLTTIRVAVLLAIRNEDPTWAIAGFSSVSDSIEAAARVPANGPLIACSYFVLSDTDDEAIASAEEITFEAWLRNSPLGPERLVYRRRVSNDGYKGGNLHDFCARWGEHFDFMLPLDVDSSIEGEAVLGMVRAINAHPRIGILQSLVVARSARTAFGKLLQYGLRPARVLYTAGYRWWAGGDGVFSGRNAVLRIAPYRTYCQAPVLPGDPPLGGHIMSHDLVESILMRCAGFEVWEISQESYSFESGPATLIDYMDRDMRYCQGNMQYSRLLSFAGLGLIGRFQLLWSIYMYVGGASFIAFVVLLVCSTTRDGEIGPQYPIGAFCGLLILLVLSPQIVGLATVFLSYHRPSSVGGWVRHILSSLCSLLLTLFLAPIMSVNRLFALAGVFAGMSINWTGRPRETQGISWKYAFQRLWPHTTIGLAITVGALLTGATWTALFFIGLLVAIPLAVITASPVCGAMLSASGLCASPEDRLWNRASERVRSTRGCRHTSPTPIRQMSERKWSAQISAQD